MKNLKQAGERLTWTNGGTAVSSGDGVLVGVTFGVACVDIANGATGALATEGVYELPKTTGVGEALAQGAIAYWDAGNAKVIDDNGGGSNEAIGRCWVAAGDNDAVVQVKINV